MLLRRKGPLIRSKILAGAMAGWFSLPIQQQQAGLSDYSALNLLNYLSGQLAVPALPAVFLALFTTAPTSDSGAGAVEVTGGAYARVQVAGAATTNATTASGNPTLHFASVPAWIFNGSVCIAVGFSVRDATTPGAIPANTTIIAATATTVTMSNNAAGGGVGGTDSIVFSAFAPPTASVGAEPATAPAFTLNANAVINFVQSTASWGTVTSFGLYDAVTSGNLLWWDYLGGFKWLPFTGSLASPSVLTSPAHGYTNGDPVVVTQKFGGILPATGGSWAGVLTVAGVTTDTFTAGVNSTGTGDGQVRKIVLQPIPANVIAQFAGSQFTLTLA